MATPYKVGQLYRYSSDRSYGPDSKQEGTVIVLLKQILGNGGLIYSSDWAEKGVGHGGNEVGGAGHWFIGSLKRDLIPVDLPELGVYE